MVIFFIACCSIATFWLLDLVVNTTPSVPMGIWKVKRSSFQNSLSLKNNFVVACPPRSAVVEEAIKKGILSSGSCPSGSVPLLKKVVQVEGETADFHGEKILLVNQVFLQGIHEFSFDSRSFGPIHIDAIQGIATPFLTFNWASVLKP